MKIRRIENEKQILVSIRIRKLKIITQITYAYLPYFTYTHRER